MSKEMKPEEIFCGYCGKKNHSFHDFCIDCGKPIEKLEEEDEEEEEKDEEEEEKDEEEEEKDELIFNESDFNRDIPLFQGIDSDNNEDLAPPEIERADNLKNFIQKEEKIPLKSDSGLSKSKERIEEYEDEDDIARKQHPPSSHTIFNFKQFLLALLITPVLFFMMSDNGLNIMTEFFTKTTKVILDKNSLNDTDFKKMMEFESLDSRKEEENSLSDTDFKKMMEFSPPNPRKETKEAQSISSLMKELERIEKIEIHPTDILLVEPKLDYQPPGSPPVNVPRGSSKFRSSTRSIPGIIHEDDDDPSQNLYSSLQPNITAEAQEVLKKTYVRKIRRKINETWTKIPLPPLYFKSSDNFTELSLDIFRDGSIYQLKIEKSSGANPLNNIGVSAVKKSAPFPEFPKELNLPVIHMKINFKYSTTLKQ